MLLIGRVLVVSTGFRCQGRSIWFQKTGEGITSTCFPSLQNKRRHEQEEISIYPTWTPIDNVVVVVVGSRITWKSENSKHSLSPAFISR